mgnify:FL=1
MIQIFILAILIALNAFFASAEIAFISLNDKKMEKKAEKGDKKAKQIFEMLQEPSKFLATIQIGITLAGFLSSAFASDAFADKLAPLLESIIPIGLSLWKGISIVIITIILSYFTLVFGELVPKRIAMENQEKVARFSIGIIKAISVITAPFVKLLTKSTNYISKLFGVSEKDEDIVTEEEIRLMVDMGEEKGTIEEEEKELINNVFDFNDTTVSEIMTHRTDIYAIDIKDNISEMLEELDEYKYSRIPVYEGTIDDIKGILFIKDLLKWIDTGKKEIPVQEIMREAYFVSQHKPINELFKELQKGKKQMAIVLDEYGGTAGIVTMEDILEELVGNIFDEYDEFEDEFEKIDDNTYRISGSISINDLKKILKVDIPEGEYDTLSGYLIELMDRIPNDGEKPVIETKQVTYKIEEYEDKRILWVKACRNHTK